MTDTPSVAPTATANENPASPNADAPISADPAAIASADPAGNPAANGDGGDNPSGEPAADNAADDENRSRNNVPARDRIKQLTDKVRSKDQLIAAQQAQIRQLTQQAGTVGDPLDYASDAEYQAAVAQNIASRTAAQTVHTQLQINQQERQLAAVETWNERCADLAQTVPDFEAVISNPNLPIPQHVTDLLLAVDNGPAVAYFLGKNPGEAARLARLSDREAAIAVGALSNRVSTPAPKRQTKAPAPVATVNGAGNTPSVNPGNLSMADYKAWRAKQKKA